MRAFAGVVLLLVWIGTAPWALGQVKPENAPPASGNAPSATTKTAQTSQPAQPPAAPATTRAAATTATTEPAGPKLTITGDIAGGVVKVALGGPLPDDVASISFEAFDSQDYRVTQMVLLVKAPWEAELKIRRAGQISVEAIVTHLGGDADPPVRQVIRVVEPRK